MNKLITRIKSSAITGKGVFALKNFKKDELILTMQGKIIKIKDPNKLPYEKLEKIFPFDIQNGQIIYIKPKAFGKYLNHSCSPNAGIKNNIDIVAMRNIKKGEEILFDYVMCNIDNFEMNCSCGSKHCRRRMFKFEELNKFTQVKYLPYVLNIIRDKFLNSNN